MDKFLDLVGANLFKEKLTNLIPTKLSELENDTGFSTATNNEITSDTEPTNLNVGDYWIKEY